MDNLTHSMLGAVLGQTGLKKKTGLGMAALIIGANIPDIDAACTLMGTQSLVLRRGITHGVLAMMILPLILTAILMQFDISQTRRGTRPPDRLPVRPGWLLLLSFIGTASHPLLDSFNSYGVRMMAPFSSRWFYGDMLFIIDLILWVILIGGFIWSRRAENTGAVNWAWRGRIALLVASGYVLLNSMITDIAESWTLARFRDAGEEQVQIVANPVPLAFWRRDMLWRTYDGRYGNFDFNMFGFTLPLIEEDGPRTGMDDPAIIPIVKRSKDARAFLYWSRMPIARFRSDGALVLTDQRFAGSFARNNFTVIIPSNRKR
ncbi:MAG: metal-dependent hydrolase [Sphingobium sp.]|jgi:inner membrane protein|nr:metal-dependent hydrolase [Sphingobium sp.]MCP5399343.1 metal-dependent hydrolase [Sphingomonas sp.]